MRYLITIAYDGSAYKGYQKQPRKKTIQSEIEKALKTINKDTAVSITAAGRTDAGVHALNQRAHFDLDINIEESKLKKALNSLLPNDIYIKKAEEMKDDFHARFDTRGKEYVYKINLGGYNPIEVKYVYQYNKMLDLAELERGLKYFEGTHNFKSFTKSNPEIKDYIRTVSQTSLKREGEYIIISFIGTGFMRYMIRNMVGTLLEIGEHKRTSDQVITILEKEDRTEAGITAPPQGLYLKDVFY